MKPNGQHPGTSIRARGHGSLQAALKELRDLGLLVGLRASDAIVSIAKDG